MINTEDTTSLMVAIITIAYITKTKRQIYDSRYLSREGEKTYYQPTKFKNPNHVIEGKHLSKKKKKIVIEGMYASVPG